MAVNEINRLIRGTLERRKKTNSLSIFKRFSNRRDRKDLEANPVMKKKSVSLEDMQSGVYNQYQRLVMSFIGNIILNEAFLVLARVRYMLLSANFNICLDGGKGEIWPYSWL
ncbi:hypothetical protein ACTXT7_016320 [Hymenolepis weldensis]